MRTRILLLVQLLIMMLLLVACGGSGGGASPADNNTGNQDNDENTAETSGPSDEELAALLFEDTGTPLEYSGNEETAELTESSVGPLLSPALPSGPAGFVPDMLGIQAGELTALVAQPASGGDNGRRGALDAGTASEYTRINRVDFCEDGKVEYSGYMLSSGRGTISGDFRDCRNGDVEVDGIITMVFSDFDSRTSLIGSATRHFNHLNISIDGVDYALTGSVVMEFENSNRYYQQFYTRSVNVVVKNQTTGMMTKTENLVERYVSGDDADSDRHMALRGDVYHSEHGRLRIDTDSLYVNSSPEERPIRPAGGSLKLESTDENRYVRVRFLDKGLAHIAFHLREPEPKIVQQAFVSLDRIDSPENTNLADSDGDQMHDSWETYYGLDPRDRNDARKDPDGDALTNLEEYFRGKQPNAETQLESRFSPAQFSLADTTSTHMPTGRQVQFDFHVYPSSRTGNYTTLYFNFPATFEVEPGAGRASRCGYNLENALICGFSSEAGPWNEYPNIRILATLPEEAGHYDIGVLLMTTESSVAVDKQVFTKTIEVQPAHVDLRIDTDEEEDIGIVGDRYKYGLSVTNTGTIAAENVRVNYTFPDTLTPVDETDYTCNDGVCTIEFNYSSVEAGETVIPDLEMVQDVSAGPALIETDVVVTTESEETDTEDNSYTASTDFQLPVADLKLEASTYQGYAQYENPAYGRDRATWTVLLGTFPAEHDIDGDYTSRLKFTLHLPPEVTLLSGPPSCDGSTGTVTCVQEARIDEWSQYIEVEFRTHDVGIHEITAELTHLGTDPDMSDNTVTLTTLAGYPMDELQAQIDAAPTGDTVTTVTVEPGYYYGELFYPDKRINLVSSEGAGQTFFSPNGDGIQPGPSGEISGFTFVYGTEGIYLTDSDVHVYGNVFDHMNRNSEYFVSNVYFQDRPASGLNMVLVEGVSAPVIESNVMRNTNCGGGWSSVIRVRDTAAPAIHNNLIVDNGECHGVYIHDTADSAALVVNNTLIGNEEALVVPGAARAAGAYVGNNIVAGNRIGFRAVTDCGLSCPNFRNNLVYNSMLADYANTQNLEGVDGNISGDPLFVDPANDDYSLQAESPAVGAGDPANAPDDDFNGDSRSGTPDMGAFERP